MSLEDKVKARIVELKSALEKFTEQANLQIQVYNVTISELEKLLVSDTIEVPPPGG